MSAALEQRLRSFKRSVKSLTARPFWLRYATLAPYRALCAGTSALTGRTMSGAAHAQRSVAEAVGYITSVFKMYKSISGVEHFHGRVAEIGPGDSCGVGLMFLADGCENVDLVDRFFSARDEHHQQSINRAITQQFPRLASLLRNQNFSESSFRNLKRHYGESAAAEIYFKINRGYDFIVSCAVLEHVYDPVRSLSVMASALNPGGTMLHQVDCQDHGQFSEHFHELKFLELPPSLYSPLKWGGGPNRVRLSSYVQVLRQEELDFTIYVEALAGIREFLPSCTTLEKIPSVTLDASRRYVSKVRDRLARPFRDMCDEDLMTTRFLVVARKAGSGQGPERSDAD